MAKGIGLIGNVRGKIGNMVGYTIKNSNNKVTQGFRVYQPDVANPRSAAQAAQRVKMQAAVLFYRALSGILDHSWQGVRYGGPSHQHFMKMILSETFTGYPYLPKGTSFMVPGEYPVSRGQLASLVPSVQTAEGTSRFVWPISTDGIGAGTNLAAFSQAVIANAPSLQNGDQLTFIIVRDTGDSILPYVAEVQRLVLDTASLIPYADLNIVKAGFFPGAFFSGGIPVGTGNATDSAIVAAAVIVSRPDADGSTWLRSNANLVINPLASGIADYFTEQQKDFAIKSYMDLVTVSSSKWYLNQGFEDIADTGETVNSSSIIIEAAVTNAAGASVSAAYLNTVNLQGVILDDPVPTYNAQGSLTAVTGKYYSVLDGKKLQLSDADTRFPASTAYVSLEQANEFIISEGFQIVENDRP